MCNASRIIQPDGAPQPQKMAIVRPLLKKRTLDPNDPASYRPISNLSFVSKVIEKVVDARLTDHVNKHHLRPVFQSAYHPFHSTETAIACILNHMIGTVDQGHVEALMLVDLSATFDTVDRQILIEILQRRFGVSGKASIGWLTTLVVDVRSSEQVAVTENSALHFGVPQG